MQSNTHLGKLNMVHAVFGGAGTPDDPAWIGFSTTPGQTLESMQAKLPSGYTLTERPSGLSVILKGPQATSRQDLARVFYVYLAEFFGWTVGTQDF